MKKIFPIVMALMMPCMHTSAQTTHSLQDATRYIIFRDEQVVAIPERHIISESQANGVCTLQLQGDKVFDYGIDNVLQITSEYTPAKAEVLTFGFSHNDNDQVYKDVNATIAERNDSIIIYAEVPVLGKRLRPNFTLSPNASLWVDDVQQVSGQTSHRFTQPMTYTLANPKHWIYEYQLIDNPSSEEEKWQLKPLNHSSQVSTNAPSNRGEDPANLWDNNTSTFFHSTWGSGKYQPLKWTDGGKWGDGITEWPYLEIQLPETENLDAFALEYTTSPQSNRNPLGFILYARNITTGQWENVGKLSQAENGLPISPMTNYSSPVFQLPKDSKYSAIRLELTEAQHKNYLVLSELRFFKATPLEMEPNQTIISRFKPFGRPCQVNVKYLTDHSTGKYQIPTIYLTFGDGVTWDHTQWIGQTLPDGTNTKEKWIKNCTFRLDGAGIWPDIDTVEGCELRGRGNSSWAWSPDSKNPYRIKFPKKNKQSPFNLTEDRQWVLISNKQSGSMTTNAIAQKIAAMVDAEALCHMIPVELYINGHYRGSYCFTEKIGISDNSVNIDERKGALLEMDDYFDEDYKFRDLSYDLPVNVKDPDFTEEDPKRIVTFDDIKNSINSFTATLQSTGSAERFLDMESWAKFWLVNDLVRNVETYHPKSCYLFNEDLTDMVQRRLWKMGPVWDFDWAFGYQETRDYFNYGAESDIYSDLVEIKSGTKFFNAIRNSKAGKKAYYEEWVNFMAEGRLEELMEYIDDYTEFVLPSIKHNNDAPITEKNQHDYLTLAKESKQWLQARANYIFNNLEKFSNVKPDIIVPEDYGTPNNIENTPNDTEDIHRLVNVYNMSGLLIRRQVPYSQSTQGLARGMYIIGGKAVVIQ